MSTAIAAQVLGVDDSTLYRLAEKGTAPVEPVRVGHSLRWRVAELAELVGISNNDFFDRFQP